MDQIHLYNNYRENTQLVIAWSIAVQGQVILHEEYNQNAFAEFSRASQNVIVSL
jgi:pectate lyase